MIDARSDQPDPPRFRVRVNKMTTGERFPLLVDRVGLPVPLANQWASFIRRPQVQANTLIEDMRTISYLYDWADRRRILLDERLTTGNGLRPAEIQALYQNLRFMRPSGRAAAAVDVGDDCTLRTVVPDVHATRVGVVREYLVWALECVLYRLDVNDQRIATIRERCLRVRRQAIEFQGPSSDCRPKRIGLDQGLRSRLLEVINPEYSGNPFLRTVRFRNWVLVLILLTFGFRRGESLKLYVSDINVKGHKPVMTIHRRPGDVLDTRGVEPAVKTLGRTVPLVPDVARLLDLFIQRHRPRFPGSDRSPFLFFSAAGKPLSIRSVNAICEQIVRRFPEFTGLLSPHILRYTYNDMFVESARRAGVEGEELTRAQNYLNGWRLDSEQSTLYTRRSAEERAHRISVIHQRSLFA